MDKPASLSRRSFVKQTAAGTAGAAVAAGPALGALGANEKVTVGFIGTGSRGHYYVQEFKACKGVEIAAICDVYEPYRRRAIETAGNGPDGYNDFRKMLERKDIDAVCICTPDHWHALGFIYSCEAKKHTYVDKPLCCVVEEGRAMVRAADRNKVVSQVGTEFHSQPFFRKAVEIVQAGDLGHVSAVHCWVHGNKAPEGLGNPPDCEPPKGLDWDLWLGPAPKVPYNRNRCLYQFRWFWDYSGGIVTDWGVHLIDIIQWALGVNAPKAAMCQGGIYALKDNRETPDTVEVTWEYETPSGGTLVTFSHRSGNAYGHAFRHGSSRQYVSHGHNIVFYGSEGTLICNMSGYEVYPENRDGKPRCKPRRSWENHCPEKPHIEDFLKAIRTGSSPICPIEVGHRSTSACQVANLSYHTKKRVEWDPVNERVTNVPEANKYLHKAYRPPWKLF